MTSGPDHPSTDLLSDYLNGRCDEKTAQPIEEHLEDCLECQNATREMSQDDSFIRLIRQATPKIDSEQTLDPVGCDVNEPELSSQPTRQSSLKPCDSIVRSIEGYTIVGELGRGGMGVVYEAIDEKLKRPVALKVMLSGVHANSVERQRFIREAETIAKLQHSGIVQIFDVGEKDGNLYIALELVSGGTLADWMVEHRPDETTAAAMMFQLAKALQYAHELGIVHRDLKPGNILIQSKIDSNDSASAWPARWTRERDRQFNSATAKITDFGLARDLDSDMQLTKTGMAVGTPAYMSPEQAVGGEPFPRPTTDVYSLGTILYEMLANRPPFEGGDIMSTMVKVIEDDPLHPSAYNPTVSRDLETICLKCLNKAPSDRYQNAGQLAEDLDLFLSGEPIRARALTVASKTMRWSRRKPLLAGTILTAGVLLLIHLFLAYVVQRGIHADTQFRIMVPFVLSGWVFLSYVAQWLPDRYRRSLSAHTTMAALNVGLLTLVLSMDSGPQSAPTPLYFLGIITIALVVPKPKATWIATVFSMVGYLTLVIVAHYFAPQNSVSFEQAIVFTCLLFAVGVQMHLLLRRSIQVESRGN
ncbi:MAG: protein kinase [Planctomycetota bacterium]